MGDNLLAVDLGTGRTATQISAGGSHTCALLDDQSVKCWGFNMYGQLGQGDTNNIGDHSGEMGDNLLAVDLGTGRTATQISAGVSHTCALLDDQSVKCWGANYNGGLGQGHTNVIGDHSGEMGDNLLAVDLGTGRTATQISVGHSHTCALLDDQSVKCWGLNMYGELGQGHTNNIGDHSGEMGDDLLAVDLGTGRTAKQISAGFSHTCAFLDDQLVKCWGGNGQGQLGQGHTSSLGDGPFEMGEYLPAIVFGAIDLSIQTQARLVDGTRTTGRVQVQYRNSWRDVCDNEWSDTNAQVLCRQLGLAGGVSRLALQGNSEFGMDDVSCIGTEADLGQCAFNGWGIHDCSAGESAGVECHMDAWSNLSNLNISARRGHTAVWDGNSSMLVFAGHAAGFFQYYDDLWRYHGSNDFLGKTSRWTFT